MAMPDQIPSDLTLEVGGNLSPDRFLAVARAFFGYVEEIGRAVSGEGGGPQWVVHVKEGSHLIGVEPAPGAPDDVVHAVYTRAEAGVRKLASGDLDGAGLSDAALKHLRALADMAENDRRGKLPVRLWVRKRPTDLGKDVSRLIREDWKADYHDFGTIEGRLEAIQDRGALHLSVRDPVLQHTVRCIVSEDMLAQALEGFGKRVEVAGNIRCRRNGTPVSIEVSRIEILPDDSVLPGLSEVRGILSRAIG